MRSRLALVALVVTVSLALGCGTMGGGSQLQNTVYDTHRRVANLDKNLESSITRLNETSAELVARVEASDQQVRTLQSTLEENQMRLTQLQQKLDTLTNRLYSERGLTLPSSPGAPTDVTVNPGEEPTVIPPPASSTPKATKPTPGAETALPPPQTTATPELSPLASAAAPPATPATPSTGSAEKDYQQAQKSFGNQDYAKALEQYSAFLQRYPESENAANATFWRAKSLQAMEKYEEAIQGFETLRSKYPANQKVPFAMHQQAVCHARLGQTDRAIKLMQQVIKDYPMTPAADQAKTDLKKLQGN